MSVKIRGEVDEVTTAIAGALQPYAAEHPSTEAEVYRYSPVSVRARVVDPDFRGKSRSERHKTVWPLLYPLDADTLADLTMLLLLTPDELDASIANRDFVTGVLANDHLSAVPARRANGSDSP